MNQHVWRCAVATVLFGLTAAVTSAPASAIEDGTVIGAQERQDFGLVTIDPNPAAMTPGAGPCSGVLIANDWVLTAGHCMAGHRTNPNSASAAMVGVDAPANEAKD
jgi:hypothetical protein